MDIFTILIYCNHNWITEIELGNCRSDLTRPLKPEGDGIAQSV
jgi:hypothetical protein